LIAQQFEEAYNARSFQCKKSRSMSQSPSYFETTVPSRRLAYRYTPSHQNSPTVVFLNGFRSDMNGEKVLFLENLCCKEGLGFLAFDYSGHGLSSGKFEEGTLSQWLADSLDIIDHIPLTPTILVGSSMGGWLAHLAALQRPNRVVGLLGIASAPDFLEELMWQKFSPNQQAEVKNQGWTVIPTDYNDVGWTITKNLIEDGRKHLLLDKPIPLTIPIRYLHGLKDASVPASYSHKLVELVTSQDVRLTLVKAGDHRLSREEDKRMLWVLLQELVTTCRLTKGL
jgi:pimeloyl-ACP methyl ester carboxylesterase